MTASKSGLRDRLLARKRPTMQVPVAVDDVTGPSREVALAEEAWRTTHLMGAGHDRDQALKATRRDLDRAIARMDGCYAQIVVQALPPVDFEALVSLHPARDGEADDEAWNSVTFPRALFLACAGEELSAAEWGSFLDGQCSQAERDQLYFAAQSVNVRAPSYAIPKD